MSYKHGVYIYEIPTSVTPPASASAGLPVVIGTAPVNLATSPRVNEPVLCYSFSEAVEALGYSDDWGKFTLCEFMDSQFKLFNVAPVVFINVLDPATHKTAQPETDFTISDEQVLIEKEGVILDSVVVKSSDSVKTFAAGTDYTLGYNSSGQTVVNIKDTGTIGAAAQLKIGFDFADPSKVTKLDIIGGYDIATDKSEGLELVNQIFPKFGLVPGQILAPGWSHYPEVSAVMTAKASNINGHFKATVLSDIDTDAAKTYSAAPQEKGQANFAATNQTAYWPMLKLGDKKYHMSTQIAGLTCKVDAQNEDIPYESPSNKAIQANGLVLADGTEIIMGPEQAAYLNGQGIITSMNFIGGFKCWGNRTAAYPGITDPKDAFVPIRRMFNWIANTLITTYWQKIDNPQNIRLVDSVVDSANIWLNGLTSRGYLLGARVEFRSDENPLTNLLDGKMKFHLYMTPPPPAEEIGFVLEYDVNYMNTLFR